MSASADVRFYKPFDEKHKQMLAICDNCRELCIPLPKEVRDYFGENGVSEYGREVNMYKQPGVKTIGCYDGYIINVKDLPKEIEKILVKVSY